MANQDFIVSCRKCCDNAKRLLSEAQLLEFEKPPATRYYLSVIAQEEAAKAFLLYLVAINAVPWTPLLLRATRDHQCKQLVGIVLEYMSPDTDEFFRRMEVWRSENVGLRLPSVVKDAMNLLYHEKIRRWEPVSWVWDEDPEYNKTALNVADGGRDREKQRALYVDLGRNGQIGATPESVTGPSATDEYERGCRFADCVRGLIGDDVRFAWDYDRVEDCFRTLFSDGVFLGT